MVDMVDLKSTFLNGSMGSNPFLGTTTSLNEIVKQLLKEVLSGQLKEVDLYQELSDRSGCTRVVAKILLFRYLYGQSLRD